MLIKDFIDNETNEKQLNMKNRLKERHFLKEIQEERRDCYICSDQTSKRIRTYYFIY